MLVPRTKLASAPLASVLLLAAVAAPADEVGRLYVEFETPVASIPLRASSRPINLPNLTYVFRAEARCPEMQNVESISISIADSRVTISPGEEAGIEQSIRVRDKQLGPLAVEEFCIADEADDFDAAESLQIEGALTAQMSLRCSGENSESISYETAALNVALRCELPEPDQSQADQAESPG